MVCLQYSAIKIPIPFSPGRRTPHWDGHQDSFAQWPQSGTRSRWIRFWSMNLRQVQFTGWYSLTGLLEPGNCSEVGLDLINRPRSNWLFIIRHTSSRIRARQSGLPTSTGNQMLKINFIKQIRVVFHKTDPSGDWEAAGKTFCHAFPSHV